MLADDADALIARVRTALQAGQSPARQEDIARLVDLCDNLAPRYATLSRFVANVPALLHPGKHSALERDTDPASAAFFDAVIKLMEAKGDFANMVTLQSGNLSSSKSLVVSTPTGSYQGQIQFRDTEVVSSPVGGEGPGPVWPYFDFQSSVTFKQATGLVTHYNKHHNDFFPGVDFRDPGYLRQYFDGARSVVERAHHNDPSTTTGKRVSDGVYFMFDHRNNALVLLYPDNTIGTYFQPFDPERYMFVRTGVRLNGFQPTRGDELQYRRINGIPWSPKANYEIHF